MTVTKTALPAAQTHAFADDAYDRKIQEVAQRRAVLEALHRHLVHGENLHGFALAQLHLLDRQISPFRNVPWKTLDVKDPRTLVLIRHVARLHRARAQTARAIQTFRQRRALILQRGSRPADEDGPTMPQAQYATAADHSADAAEKPITGKSPADPPRMSTAQWMRWRANQLHKRK